MCGITGKISFVKDGSFAEVGPMERALNRRGPDSQGAYADKRVSLAMRRLSIIDLTTGDQPLFNEDKSLVIFGNGEIYNYLELQKLLRQKGHHLRTGSDIETVVHLYEEYGLGFISKLRGIFALALYDKKRQKLFLCRDRFGEKPLYYANVDGGILFSSELKSLLKAKKIAPVINPTSLSEFFHFNFVPEPNTILKDVHKIPASHFLEVDGTTGTSILHQYWNVDTIPWKETPNLPSHIKSSFAYASEITSRADVPIGIALSGGIDSSAILATLAPHQKDRLTAFSVGYEHQPASDERQQAKEFAEHFGVPFYTAEIKDDEVLTHFPQNIWNIDDPIAELGSHNLNEIYKLAHAHKVKVLLSGVGGDELFWGYPWFTSVVKTNLEAFRTNHGLKKLQFEDLRPKFIKAKQFTTHFFTGAFSDAVDQQKLTGHLDARQLRTQKDVVRRLQHLLQSRWLVSHVNAINDRLSMANSVELRTPFLDYKLAELAYGSPTLQKGYQLPNKYWFKKALATELPPHVVNRKKRGFTPPTKRWLFRILNKYIHLLPGGYLQEQKFLSGSKLSLLNKGWWLTPLYWDEVYKMITMEVWAREYIWGQKPSEIQ